MASWDSGGRGRRWGGVRAEGGEELCNQPRMGVGPFRGSSAFHNSFDLLVEEGANSTNYRLACRLGVLMVGTLGTRAASTRTRQFERTFWNNFPNYFRSV